MKKTGKGQSMHQIIFYPVGNGDSSQIALENGKRLLFDYRHLKKTEEGEGPEINLKERLKRDLKKANRNDFDVVAFTHADSDHIENSTEFFELLHAEEYQDKDRVKIKDLWVPAAMILEEAPVDEQHKENVLWRQEARYRLRKGKGIRVFSRPDKLKTWLEENGLTLESRKHLITDAGQLVPSFDLDADGVEFFCHSPFIKHVDHSDDLRNPAALILNVRFKSGQELIDYFAVGDTEWDVLEDIVAITKYHKREDRLGWDLFKAPHHCSYKALSDEKGKRITEPKPLVKELLLAGKRNGHVVSSSDPIADNEAAYEQEQPPHVQAKNCYLKHLEKIGGGQFFVTMEEPNAREPEPLVFNIDANGLTRQKDTRSPAIVITSREAPRAG
jgi:hypothetical protein